MDLHLTDKVVVVTGASAGIGLAAAQACAAEGASVALVARNADRVANAAALCAESAAGDGRVIGIVADLAVAGEPERAMAAATEQLGPVDVLINNVGLAVQRNFLECTDDNWDELWQLNVMSYVRAIRAVLPSMRERRSGCIVNVSSTAGKRPSTGMADYSVTKAAVLSLSRLIADTYAGDGIRSVAICPGPTATPAWLAEGGLADQMAARGDMSHDDALKKTGAGRPLGRLAEPEEIAAMIAFVASPQASYVTGAAIGVDGGSVPVII